MDTQLPKVVELDKKIKDKQKKAKDEKDEMKKKVINAEIRQLYEERSKVKKGDLNKKILEA